MTIYVRCFVLIVLLSMVTVTYGVGHLTVNLLNSTGIGSTEHILNCPCDLSFTITLTDNSSCKSQSGLCGQCQLHINTTADLNIDNGHGGNCVINNRCIGKNNLYLGVDIYEIDNRAVFMTKTLNETFCQLIDKSRTFYKASDRGNHSSLMMEVIFDSTTDTTKLIHQTSTTRTSSLSKDSSSYKTTATTTEKQDTSTSPSTGALIGIVVGGIAGVAAIVVLFWAWKSGKCKKK